MQTKFPLVALVAALLVAPIRAEQAPAPPAAVMVVAEIEAVTVSWLPSPDASLSLEYVVYGRDAGGDVEELAALPASAHRAEVRVGFAQYGVAARVGEQTGAIVFGVACVFVRPGADRPLVVDEDCKW